MIVLKIMMIIMIFEVNEDDDEECKEDSFGSQELQDLKEAMLKHPKIELRWDGESNLSIYNNAQQEDDQGELQDNKENNVEESICQKELCNHVTEQELASVDKDMPEAQVEPSKIGHPMFHSMWTAPSCLLTRWWVAHRNLTQIALVIRVMQLFDHCYTWYGATHFLKAGNKKSVKHDDAAVSTTADQCRLFKLVSIQSWLQSKRRKLWNDCCFQQNKIWLIEEGHICADGNVQRDCILKEETMIPTISIWSGFLVMEFMCMRDEGHKVAIIDTQNAFVQIPHSGKMAGMKIRG